MKYELYSGAGNDFVMINNITEKTAFDKQKELTVKICNENFPKIDGVIFADKPLNDNSAVRMNYYNRDGSFGAMCGNGARCIAMFAYNNGIVNEQKFYLEAVDDVYSAEIVSDEIAKIGFPEPKEVRTDIRITASEGNPLNVSYTNVGSDHIILFINEDINKLYLNCADMDKLDVENQGRMLRFHKDFEPRGGNVNFAEVQQDGSIRLRTYERGVERETLACGTGIISTGIIAMLKKGISSPVKVKVQSGEVLLVTGRVENGKILDLSLTGSARKFGDGDI
ncbi:MAG TPA: diaminopimelate epimerase [Ignavibacteria bacterium]|nr:diaminopimelate epimerase [Ignavibacteria bacterium]